jgi:hypothetical protein
MDGLPSPVSSSAGAAIFPASVQPLDAQEAGVVPEPFVHRHRELVVDVRTEDRIDEQPRCRVHIAPLDRLHRGRQGAEGLGLQRRSAWEPAQPMSRARLAEHEAADQVGTLMGQQQGDVGAVGATDATWQGPNRVDRKAQYRCGRGVCRHWRRR